MAIGYLSDDAVAGVWWSARRAARRGKLAQLLWAEFHQEVLEPVPHRHVVMTIPRLLRPLLRRRRELLRDLARCASDALGAYVRGGLSEDVRPGIVVSIATAGDLARVTAASPLRGPFIPSSSGTAKRS